MGDATVYGFADALRQQPKTLAYVVAYNSRSSATGAWRRSAKEIARQLNNQSVPADRIKIIFAGYDEKLSEYEAAKIQLWILPEGAPPPAVSKYQPMRLWILSDLHPELTRGWDLLTQQDRVDFPTHLLAARSFNMREWRERARPAKALSAW